MKRDAITEKREPTTKWAHPGEFAPSFEADQINKHHNIIYT